MIKHQNEWKGEDLLHGMEVLFHHERNMLSAYSTYKIIKKANKPRHVNFHPQHNIV
jgi:6-phosphogluconolactonase (cycloisomerase 2 family)